ncbi:hypothetical protein GH733_011937 [Mirounga leonina]|nr:hypothetical protein GH733_011937 [Mirounga leonina]
MAQLQAEAHCPICLDYPRDPVTLHCRYNFYGSCFSQCWKDLEDISSDHPRRPIEQAAAGQGRPFRGYIKPSKKQVENAERGFEIQVSKSLELRWKVEKQRGELHSECGELQHLLGEEQDILL